MVIYQIKYIELCAGFIHAKVKEFPISKYLIGFMIYSFRSTALGLQRNRESYEIDRAAFFLHLNSDC